MLFDLPAKPAPSKPRRLDMTRDAEPLFEGFKTAPQPTPARPKPTTPTGPLFALMTAPAEALPGMTPFDDLTPRK